MSVNYPELGTVDKKSIFYPDGSTIVHPSGVIYVRRDGHWVRKVKTRP